MDSSTAMPKSTDLKNQLEQTREALTHMGSTQITFFNYSRNLEIDQIHDAYHARMAEKNIKEARELVLRSQTLYPESPVTAHIVGDLAALEKKQFDEWLDQANIALSGSDDLRADFCFMKARQIFPDNSDLKRQWSNFQSGYLAKSHFQPFDTLYQDQLYKVAALHYVKEETHQSVEGLKELLRKNAVHEEGNLFMEFLLDKKILNEEELKNEKSSQVGLVHQTTSNQ